MCRVIAIASGCNGPGGVSAKTAWGSHLRRCRNVGLLDLTLFAFVTFVQKVACLFFLL